MADRDTDQLLAPTPHRRRQAREQGRVVQSQDLGSAVILVGSLAALTYLGGSLVQFLAGFVAQGLGGRPWLSTTPGEITAQWSETVMALGKVLLPVLAAILALSAVASLLQIGWLFLPHRALPDAARISPQAGLQRVWSSGSAVRLLMGLIKIVIVVGVTLVGLYGQRSQILGLAALAPNRAAVEVAQILGATCLKAGLALVALGGLDYLYQRWRHEQSLKMTPQELRDEMRNMQGDPRIANRRRTARNQWNVTAVDGSQPRSTTHR